MKTLLMRKYLSNLESCNNRIWWEGCDPVQPNNKLAVKEDCFKATDKNRYRSHLNYLFINARSLKNKCKMDEL